MSTIDVQPNAAGTIIGADEDGAYEATVIGVHGATLQDAAGTACGLATGITYDVSIQMGPALVRLASVIPANTRPPYNVYPHPVNTKALSCTVSCGRVTFFVSECPAIAACT